MDKPYRPDRFPVVLPLPVLTFAYAERIAGEWNSVDPWHDHVGFVTEFDVPTAISDRYEPQEVNRQALRELWIPAEDLVEFSAGIVGTIRVAAEYRRGERINWSYFWGSVRRRWSQRSARVRALRGAAAPF